MGTVKKRILALVLALVIVGGLGEHAWAEVFSAVASPSPEVSAQPEESATPEERAAPQESTAPAESETPEESTAPEEDGTDEAPVETPILDEPYALPGVEDFAVTQPAPRANLTTVEGLQDVAGTTIDAFDYWLQDQDTPDDTNGEILPDSGINAGHVLLFGKGMSGETDSDSYAAQDAEQDGSGGIDSGGVAFCNNGHWNGWSGVGGGPINGIVDRVLGADGYPVLALDARGWVAASLLDGRNRTESLSYLFDPDVKSGGKESYKDVGGLLQVDTDGYYYYNSTQNFASLVDGGYQNFVLYQGGRIDAAGNSPNGQFFPFDTGNEASELVWDTELGENRNPKSTDGIINHYFGLHMQSRFVQQYGGHTDESQQDAVTYQFSGDDDVWIFIDGVLVADLGGIHDAVSVSINFKTGEISISSASEAQTKFTTYTTTLRAQFIEAGKEDSVAWSGSGSTFADKTYHILDFFYLERGNTDSNMNLKYNLVSVPESAIIKVDQTGDPVPGAKFELWTANQAYDEQTKVATGTTDSEGQFVLLDTQGDVVSLQDVWTDLQQENLIYTNSDGQKRGNLLLVESAKPEGYRSAGDVRLYLVNIDEKVLLLSDNYWDTGSYAYTNSTVVMDGTVRYGTEQSANLKTGGTLFAVVLRRTTNVGTAAPSKTDLWSLVTGNATDGWHTSEATQPDEAGIEQLLTELKKTENRDNYFVALADASGEFKISASDLPGEITSYYYVLGEGEKAKTEYTLAFYYTAASSVADAVATNTWRVTNSNGWSRLFSANVHVPNIKNRLFVQKLAPDGTTYLEKAQFTLYDANYYDERGNVNPNATSHGTITTRHLTKEGDGVLLDGGGVFPLPGKVLPSGTYYLVETVAPQGYDINPTVTKIVVDNTGVYADAGEKEDGVVVARGMGSIVKSMAEFASLGDIDTTLNNIVARFYTVPSDTISGNENFQDFVWRETGENGFEANRAAGVTYHPAYMYDESTGTLELYDRDTSDGKTPLGMHMEYSTQAGLEYGVERGISETLGDQALVWMTTDTGWSKLMMEQCGQHSASHSTNLTDPELYDLTNLFSGSVIVQVTDQHTTSLTINKKVQGVGDADVTGQTYTFTVEKLETDGQSVDTDYTGAVTVRQDGTDTEAQFQSGVLTVSRQGVGETVLLDVENGRYRVTETGHGSDKVGETQWQSAAYTTTSRNVTIASGTAVADISSDAADTATAAVQVTNLYAGAQPLTVTKTVGGTLGDTSQDFTFTLSLRDKSGADYTQGITAIKSGAGMTQPETLTLTLTQSGNYTFTLKHGQRIFLQIPYGSQQVEVTETAELEYTTDSRSYATSADSVPNYSDGMAVQTIANMDGGYTVDFYNERNLGAPPSGVAPMSPGYTVMLWVGGASALVIFGCSFLVWRRRRRDWM